MSDFAREAFIQGLAWALGFGLMVAFLAWGWHALADLFKRVV